MPMWCDYCISAKDIATLRCHFDIDEISIVSLGWWKMPPFFISWCRWFFISFSLHWVSWLRRLHFSSSSSRGLLLDDYFRQISKTFRELWRCWCWWARKYCSFDKMMPLMVLMAFSRCRFSISFSSMYYVFSKTFSFSDEIFRRLFVAERWCRTLREPFRFER